MAATRRKDLPSLPSPASSASSGPLEALRQRMIAPTRNSAATTPLTSASGSSDSSEPAVTAMATCSPNAVADADEDRQRWEAGGQHQAGEERLVRQLHGEHQHERGQDDREDHVSSYFRWAPPDGARAASDRQHGMAAIEGLAHPRRGADPLTGRPANGRQHVDQRTGGYSPSPGKSSRCRAAIRLRAAGRRR